MTAAIDLLGQHADERVLVRDAREQLLGGIAPSPVEIDVADGFELGEDGGGQLAGDEDRGH